MSDARFVGLCAHFPALRTAGGEITSPTTPTYNCIAWAAGDATRWWWPTNDGYWPPTALATLELNSFVQAFESVGYSKCPHGSFEIGFEKVAIYCVNGQPSHAARQLPNGSWTSKLGQSFDIAHHAVEGVEGLKYGVVSQFLRRRQEG